jgi:SulP family sulfate permease
MASLFSGIIVLVVALTLGPLVAYLPRTALAGVLIYAAFGMADRAEIRRTQGASVGDTAILWATFAAALILPLQYAVLTGVFVSFVRYVSQTSHPAVLTVVPDEGFEHFESRPDAIECPQLGVLTIGGALYFGATRHVEDQIRAHIDAYPDQKYLLLRLHRVNHVDMTGIHMLEGIVRLMRNKGGDLYLMRIHRSVMERMEQTGFDQLLGLGNFLPVESAVPYLFHRVLDPAQCIYSCQRRVWKECQTLPKSYNPSFVPLYQVEAPNAVVPSIDPTTLYALMREMETFWLVDVREMAEWESEGFIRDSQLIPLPRFFQRQLNLPTNRDIVFVSRTGRRSRHLVSLLQRQGWQNIYNLSGGVVEWRRVGLPLERMHFSAEIDPTDERYE